MTCRKGEIPDAFKPMYEVLVGIRNDLDKLSVTQAWSLRETDLYDYQRQLDKIDESRVDGNWVDEEGKPAELYVQRVYSFLGCKSSISFTNWGNRHSFTSFGGRMATFI